MMVAMMMYSVWLYSIVWWKTLCITYLYTVLSIRGNPAKRALSAMRKHGGKALLAGYHRIYSGQVFIEKLTKDAPYFTCEGQYGVSFVSENLEEVLTFSLTDDINHCNYSHTVLLYMTTLYRAAIISYSWSWHHVTPVWVLNTCNMIISWFIIIMYNTRLGIKHMYHIIALLPQVYRLSAVHCQVTRYSQRVPGYLTRYSVSAN